MINVNVINFMRFLNQSFKLLNPISSSISDSKRSNPKIAAKYIFNSLFLALSIGIKSLLSLDKFLKRLHYHASHIFLPLKKISDSLIQQVLKYLDLPTLQKIHKYVLMVLNNKGYFKDNILDLRIGIIDGSVLLNNFPLSCFLIAGRMPILADWEVCDKKGEELTKSKRLLNRVLGKYNLDVILLDGLYYDKEIMNMCSDRGVDFLIKTREDRLLIIKEAEKFFENAGLFDKDLMIKEGYDDERMASYKVMGVNVSKVGEGENEKWLYVYKVSLDFSHKKKISKEEFYAITTIGKIELIMDLSFKRWVIENNLFKKLKQRHGLGRSVYVRESKEGFERLMYIVGISFNIVEGYFCEERSASKGEDKLSSIEMIERLKDSFISVMGMGVNVMVGCEMSKDICGRW